MVLERVRAGTVDIVDPAVGRRRLFAEGFGGLVLTFAPGAGFEARSPPRRRART